MHGTHTSGRPRLPFVSGTRLPFAQLLTALALGAAGVTRADEDLFQRESFDFDLLLQVPKVERLSASLLLEKTSTSVVIEAALRFDRRGRIVCGGSCTIDGVAADVRGTLKERKDGWYYTISLRNESGPKAIVKLSGRFGDPWAKAQYNGPKGKETIRETPLLLSPTVGLTVATIHVVPTLTRSGKIKGVVRFSAGFGDPADLDGKIKGKLMGDILTFSIAGGGKKLNFAGFRQNGIFIGGLKVKYPPEKRFLDSFRFPDDIPAVPQSEELSNAFETHSPFSLSFTFPILDSATGRPLLPREVEANPPTRQHFTIAENGETLDEFETNWFVARATDKQVDAVLLLDYTNSMRAGDQICPMVGAAIEFIANLKDNTNLALMSFYERQGGIEQIEGFTTCDEPGRVHLIRRLLSYLPPEHGATPLWDAVLAAVNTFRRTDDAADEPRSDSFTRAVIFITDGHDTSSLVGALHATAVARALGINLYPLAFAPRPEFPADRAALSEAATQTGGILFERPIDPCAGGGPCLGCELLSVQEGLDNGQDTEWVRDHLASETSNINQLFDDITGKLVGEWTLTYITLRTSGSYRVNVTSTYPGGIIRIPEYSFTVDDDLRGDIRIGRYAVRRSPADVTEHIVSATYVPRGVSEFRFRISVNKGQVESVTFREETGLISEEKGWRLEPTNDGYRAWSATGEPAPYGGFGALVVVKVSRADSTPNVQLLAAKEFRRENE